MVMDNHLYEQETVVEGEEPLLVSHHNKKGGFRTLPFIIANESFEKMATYGVAPNMTLYLMNYYHMGMVTTSNLLSIWTAAINMTPVLGAIVADSYLGQFYTIGFGSIICLMGIILLWSTTIIPQARPPPCDQSSDNCSSTTIFQYAFLCSALGLISIGAGGIRASSLAFGANQLENGEFQRRPGLKESYFGWYYASYTFSILIGLTVLVYIQDNMGWGVGFAVPAVLMLLSVICFFMASPFYIKLKRETNLVIGLIQVAVAAYRNRHLKLSDGTDNEYHCKTYSSRVCPSKKLRFLNKACIIGDIERDLSPVGEAIDPWSLCTVDRVEELKALLRVIPIWSTGMIMSVNVAQTFPILQAASMNRTITTWGFSFTIPAASFSMFAVVAVIAWVFVYDRIFLPLASRVVGRKVHVTTRTRMRIGIFISSLAMMVTAIVESVRRGFANSGGAAMSAMWLVPQHCLIGFAESSNYIAQVEFYFSELPRSMSSIATTLQLLGLSSGSLVATLVLNAVDSVSKSGGNDSWISTDINKGHYDYYHLILAGLSMANLIYFHVCCSAYGPFKGEKGAEQEEGTEEEE